MTRFRWILALSLFAIFLSLDSAHAQGRYSPFRGVRPRLSPYFDLFRRNTGPVDNYNYFVRPQQQLNRAIKQQERSLGRLRQTTSRLQQQQRAVRPTGTGGHFMDFSHYYNLPSGSGGSGRR